MKWFTHIFWNMAVATALCRIFAATCDIYTTLLATAAVHTVATDILGHSGLRRNRYHDALSIAFAAALAAVVGNPILLAFGPLHVILDYASPGRLAVSWWYNVLWSTPAVFILSRFITVA